jgi:hypothetical protein
MMNLHDIKSAQQLSYALAAQGWPLNDIPVDVEKMADALGVTIDSHFEPRFLDKIAAVEGKRIWISSYEGNEYTALRRHIVAHELGHIVLHSPTDEPLHFTDTTGTLRGSVLNGMSPEEKAHEIAANEFAAEILLPLDPLKEVVQKIPNMEQLSTERVLAKIAEHFDVPLSLVSLRIDVLARQDRSESTASVQRS